MPKLRVIYEPAGRALEYATLACTLYRGCKHDCRYCFNIRPDRRTREQFTASAEPRDGIMDKLGRDLEQLWREHKTVDQKLFLSFGCDPYPLEHNEITREAIQLCIKYGMLVRILTKAPNRSRRDWDLFKQHGVELGVTFSCWEEFTREAWEPNSEIIAHRFHALLQAHEQGIFTWVSMEPVVHTIQAIDALHALGRAGCVDEVRVGMLNHLEHIRAEFPELVERDRVDHIPWDEFATHAVAALRQYPWKWVMKEGLAKLAPRGTPTNSDAAPMIR
jgi:DNA repair photolyase